MEPPNQPPSPPSEQPLAPPPEQPATPAPVSQPALDRYISPPNPEPPVSPANPIVQPAPSPGAEPPRVLPAAVVSATVVNPGVNRADSRARGRRSWRKRRLVLAGGIGVLLVVLVGLLAGGAFSRWQTITYDNGKGSTYRLTFYAHYELKNLASSGQAPGSGAADADKPAQQLVSKVSEAGKAPLTLFISSTALTAKAGAAPAETCDDPSTPRAFGVHDAAHHRDVNVCAIRQDGQDIVYLAQFQDAGHAYLVMARQDIAAPKITGTPSAQAARDLAKKTGLKTYQADLQKIISSISLTN